MRKQLFIKGAAALMVALTALLAQTGTSKPHAFIQARYTTSAFPTICNINGTLPPSCGTTNTGQVCTVGSNTYYMGTTCVQVYYLQQ